MARAKRRRHQEVAQVGGKHVDRFPIGLFLELGAHVSGDLVEQQAVVSIGGRILDVTGPDRSASSRRAAAQNRPGLFRVGSDAVSDKSVLLAPKDREKAVSGDFRDRFDVIVIVGELALLLRLAPGGPRLHVSPLPGEVTDLGAPFGRFDHALGDDVPRPLQRVFGALYALVGVDETRREFFGRPRWILLGPHTLSQGFEPALARDRRPGAAFGPVRQIKVLEFGYRRRPLDGGLQLWREFVLAANTLEDELPALEELAVELEALHRLADGHVLGAAGHFLAVAGDEGHGAPFVQEPDDRRNGGRPESHLGGDHSSEVGSLCGFAVFHAAHYSPGHESFNPI